MKLKDSTIKMDKIDRKLIGDAQLYEKGGIACNPYSKEEVMLSAEALSVYDIIVGSEICGDSALFYSARDVFLKNWPDEYMKLVD
jgi:hypothetical protein